MLREELFKDFLKNKKNLTIRYQLIDLHLPLVNKLVKQFKYYPRILQKEDLYQEGVLGLIKALDNYVDLGYDFIAYATTTIKSEIRKIIRKNHSPSIPQKNHKKDNLSFQEEFFEPYQINKLNPHQLWLKQVKHENFLKKMKAKLSENEFQIIHLSFSVPLGNINENYQTSYSNEEIAQKLHLSLKQVENIKNIAIKKLKKTKNVNLSRL
ncbi:sigma-70 family RNA polymerase sigma factor [Paulownia witches'-broom phytoplasma]|uniref:Sigma-70 family RNA polymerase sigma factor n=1 Tax=Paulownia witches'-broom phytoplasma TaxID=39647 RepID=A0ABX8TQJ3_9MOLU|nr:sigma-70 family RNA polymerase sigma factor [Paulownia witches'-broom phytoplasma]QYC30815.1 sigma-70 family RNA polymerase sigma factor [Paulownia witches'-broom phytoplasma]GLH60640.1 DNA-directed RNA polymerase sigma-70 factor [Paulownia witches'-broom phytoplasma]